MQKLNQADLKQFYKNYYLSSESSIVIVGDVSMDEAKKISESISQGLPQGNTKHNIASVTDSNYAGIKK